MPADQNQDPAVEIRDETPADVEAIHDVTERAFRGREYAGGDEQLVIERLRDSGALAVSLVAVEREEVIGHIAFSPAQCEDASHPWFALGPVSVIPHRQSQGIGAALIHRGLTLIAQRGALGCILTGNPEYYRRFGFERSDANTPAQEAPEYFMRKCLTDRRPEGRFTFHPAFYGPV